MTELHFQPIQGEARQILRTIMASPEIASCNMKEVMVLRLVCEEIVMNVTSYAYPEGVEGWLDVEIQKTDRIVIRFKDGGTPFNPLKQEMTNTALSWEKRRIGGLGIFLVIKKMDAVRYAYEDCKNILTIEKTI